MVVGVQISGFRGVIEGGVDGLAPISILVGPNNSGKSTLLEAIAVVGKQPRPEDVATWLLRRGGSPVDALEHVVRYGATEAAVEVRTDREGSGWLTTISVRVVPDIITPGPRTASGLQAELTAGQKRLGDAGEPLRMVVGVTDGGQLTVFARPQVPPTFPVTFVDIEAVRAADALEEAHARLGKAGRLDLLVHALQRSLPGLTGLVIYKSGSRFVLHTEIGKQRPVPAYLAGDGLKRFLALAAAALDTPAGVVLLEEPESYQHPRYLEELATLLHLAAREGTQIILSTHSMELIDLLLHAPEAEGLSYPAIHRMRLFDGKLRATTLDREHALLARDELLEDLRA